jgi:hypothetical protein
MFWSYAGALWNRRLTNRDIRTRVNAMYVEMRVLDQIQSAQTKATQEEALSEKYECKS